MAAILNPVNKRDTAYPLFDGFLSSWICANREWSEVGKMESMLVMSFVPTNSTVWPHFTAIRIKTTNKTSQS